QMKKLLAETEKLSDEVLGLRGESARLRLQLEVGAGPPPPRGVTRCHPLAVTVTVPPASPSQVQEKNHRAVVAVYRTHLLSAAQGFMDEGVHAALLRILRAE
ncbi:UACA protein, partial [Lophotis ruficrista]|nr:UACA protein [Lophotis ruficrista]